MIRRAGNRVGNTVVEALVTRRSCRTPHTRRRKRSHRARQARPQELLSCGPYDRRQAQPGHRPLICLTLGGYVLRLLRSGALALTVLCLASGVAKADPIPVQDVAQSADTDDGWHLS